MIAELLRRVPLFAELSDAELAEISASATIEAVPTGTPLVEEGSAATAMYVVVEGELAVTKRGAAGSLALNTCGPGDLIGELGLLQGKPRSATVTASRPSRVVVLGASALHDLVRASPTATLALLRTMANRLENTESVLRQHDQLAALGRMAAGIAHEFNNPASAVKRGAVELGERLASFEALALEVRASGLDPDQLRRFATARPPPAGESTMQRARREEAVEAALRNLGVPEPWQLAPALAATGFDAAALDDIAATLPREAAGLVVRWIETTATLRSLARDVADAATRISDLVHAVRAHSHLGEAPIQRVDLHDQLDTTLRLLHHRRGAVEVRRQYAADLPAIEAHGSELNQVWTNLIDNALQAMDGKGTLEVATARLPDDRVAVSITDSGPGIPPALQEQIFRPFFTTKPPGAGSGLGLHLSYNVVVRRHRGRIDFESRPGHTRFTVTLPVRPEPPGEGPR